MDVLDEDENQAIQRLKFLSLMSRFIWNNISVHLAVQAENGILELKISAMP